jgi:hypothetical protein
MSSVNHVIINRDDHHRWIEYDATYGTGVHSWVTLFRGFPFLVKLLEYLEMFRAGLLVQELTSSFPQFMNYYMNITQIRKMPAYICIVYRNLLGDLYAADIITRN